MKLWTLLLLTLTGVGAAAVPRMPNVPQRAWGATGTKKQALRPKALQAL